MASPRFIKKIKNYAVISFILPLLAINSCLLLYKFLGNFDYGLYPDLNWNKIEHSYKYSEYDSINKNIKTQTFTNCSIYQYKTYYITIENLTILATGNLEYGFKNTESILWNLKANNRIKTVIIKHNEIPTNRCIKENQFLYSLLKNFGWLETILIHTIQKNNSGFSKIEKGWLRH